MLKNKKSLPLLHSPSPNLLIVTTSSPPRYQDTWWMFSETNLCCVNIWWVFYAQTFPHSSYSRAQQIRFLVSFHINTFKKQVPNDTEYNPDQLMFIGNIIFIGRKFFSFINSKFVVFSIQFQYNNIISQTFWHRVLRWMNRDYFYLPRAKAI